MSDNWMDFNNADSQNSFDLIPKRNVSMKMRHSTFEFNVKSVVSDKHYFRPSGGGFLRHGRIYGGASI